MGFERFPLSGMTGVTGVQAAQKSARPKRRQREHWLTPCCKGNGLCYIAAQAEGRFKVEMTWSGSIPGESGYGADGIILISDVGKTWRLKDWSPSWQSSRLKDYNDMRQIGNAFRSLFQQ